MHEVLRNTVMYIVFFAIVYIAYKILLTFSIKKHSRLVKHSILNVLVFSSLLIGTYMILYIYDCNVNVISKYGSVFGAIIGLLGVTITLNFNEEKNFESKRLEYKPYINIKVKSKKTNKIIFVVSNNGRGEAKEIYCQMNSSNLKINDTKKYPLLTSGENFDLTVDNVNSSISDTIKFKIEYNDLFDCKEIMICEFSFADSLIKNVNYISN